MTARTIVRFINHSGAAFVFGAAISLAVMALAGKPVDVMLCVRTGGLAIGVYWVLVWSLA